MTRAERFRARLCVDCGERRPRVLEDGTPAIRCVVCHAGARAETYTLGTEDERREAGRRARLLARQELRQRLERGQRRCKQTIDLEDYLRETA